MNRPLGVTLIAIALAAFPAIFIWNLYQLCAEAFAKPEAEMFDFDTWLVSVVLVLLMIFLSGAMALGLWSLEDGARRATVVVFLLVGLPATITLIATSYGDPHELSEQPLWSLSFLVLVLLIDSTAVYLLHPRTKAHFGRLEILRLH